MMVGKVDVERFEEEQEFEAYYAPANWVCFYVDDEDFNKMEAVSKFIAEIMTAVQIAKKVGIEEFSIIRIFNSENIPVHSVLTKRILENFGELLEVAEELVEEDNTYKVELIDLARYDKQTVVELLDEAEEYDLIEKIEDEDDWDEDY